MNQDQNIQAPLDQSKEQRTSSVLKPHKKRRLPKIFWILLVLFIILFSLVFAKAYSLTSKVFVSHSSFFSRLTGIAFKSQSVTVQGEDQNGINILLLGYGGEGHDGPFLTDSIILATLKPHDHQVLLSSIPRDLAAHPDNSADDQKINSVFAYGIAKKGGFGQAGEETTQAISKISGLSIPYFVSIDFSGFKKAIDQVGGIDVTIDRTFTDSLYPDSGIGYLPPITFKKGTEHMNGTRALQFARSRHGDNNEGSDFARSARQQKIINAFKEKIQDLSIKDTGTISQLVNILADHLHTNLEPNQLLHIADLMKPSDQNSTPVQIASQNLGVETGLICEKYPEHDPENPKPFVLVPCSPNMQTQIFSFFQKGFQGVELRDELASVILENAGSDYKKYAELKKTLQDAGITVFEVSYKGLPISKSVLYTINSKPKTTSYIEKQLGISAQPKPAAMKAASDLVLIFAE